MSIIILDQPAVSPPPPSTPPTSSSPSGPHFVALAVHDVRISWDKAATNQGWFTLNSSLLGGADKLAPSSQLIPTFSGPYDDMTQWLLEASWSRGRSATLAEVEQGKWTGSFLDPDGRFNPDNPLSPLYGQSSQPGRPIRHWERPVLGGFYRQFLGYIRTTEYEPSKRVGGILHVEADDLFVKLDVPAPVILPMVNTTTGAVIGAILDSIGWSDPAYRALAVGDTITSWPGIADGSSTPLQLISELLAVELGLFYIDGGGVAVYESRNARATKLPAYSISDGLVSHSPGISLDKVGNKATSTKTGGPPQTYADPVSADPLFGFGPRPLPDVDSPLFFNDNRALAHAQYRVNISKSPKGNLWALAIDNRTNALLLAAIDLEVSDRVQTFEDSTGASFDGFVERIERTVTATPYKETATYVLSERGQGQNLFILGTSFLGATDVLSL